MSLFIKFSFIIFFIFLTVFLMLENYLIANDKYLQAGGNEKFFKGFSYLSGGASLLALMDTIRSHIQNKPEDPSVILTAEKKIKELKEENIRLAEEKEKLQNQLVEIKQKSSQDVTFHKIEKLEIEELEEKLAEVSANSVSVTNTSDKLEGYTYSISSHFSEISKIRNDTQLSNLEKDSLVKAKTEEIKLLLEQHANSVSTLEELNNIKSSAILNFNLQEFLSTLTILELFAFTTLCFNSVILNCLVSIVFIYYGDFLIRKFNLELKYPKLAKFIEFRRSLQSYSVKFNLFLIFISVIPQLIACALVLWHYLNI